MVSHLVGASIAYGAGAGHRDHCRRRACETTTHDRRDQHRNDERERHVGVGQVVADGNERARDHENREHAEPGSHRRATVSGVARTTP